MAPPTIKIGFPRDPVALAKKKKHTLDSLLASRARAWDGFFDGLSLAYIDAHAQHTATLGQIKEDIRNQTEFLRTVVFGVLLPSFIGGAMSALVADKGKQVMAKMFPIVERYRPELHNFAAAPGEVELRSAVVGGLSAATKDLVKLEVGKALNGLAPSPGSEWDAVGDQPIKFFVQLRKMVNDFATDATHNVEGKSHGSLEDYVNTINAYLLSPFIQNAPMDTSILYDSKDLAPVFEVFLWVVWAQARDQKYWSTKIGLATEPDHRSFVGKIWDGVTLDDDALDRVKAWDAVKQLDPILARLIACRINQSEITQTAGWDSGRRILNILWVRFLGAKHPNTLLADLVSNISAKVRTSALDDGPITKFRRLM